MNRFKVYVTDNRHGNYEIERRILAEVGAEVIVRDCGTKEKLLKDCADADGLLLDMAPCDAEVINGLRHCRVINRYGVGYDNVDIAAATARGIQVTYVPDYCMEDVSDHALALMLSCLRQVAYRDRSIREGKWNLRGRSFRLAGKTLGVLGFGRIARTLVKKCGGFGFARVLVYDPYVPEEAMRDCGAEKADLEEVLAQADFLSIHMPVTPETRGIINERTLNRMKSTAILINTSRGQLVDDEALVTALRQGRILAAGLDTHNQEPLTPENPYCALDNVILTDHTAYSTEEGVIELKTKAAQNIAAVLSGRAPAYPVNRF